MYVSLYDLLPARWCQDTQRGSAESVEGGGAAIEWLTRLLASFDQVIVSGPSATLAAKT